MKKLRVFLALMIVLVLCFTLVGVSLGDAGSYAGDSDYGGSWDSGSDSSWSSSSSWSSDSSWDDDDSSGGGGFSIIVFTIVAIIIVAIIFGRNDKGKKGGGSGNGGSAPRGAEVSAPKGEKRSVEQLREDDPAFSEEKLLQNVSNDYIKMQTAWMTKDWEPMRMIMTDALYSQFANQLNAMKRAGRTNYVERIAVLGTSITGVYRDEKNDIITVQLRTRIVDYTVDDKTGNVVSGDKNRELFMTYEWTLIRPIGTKTAEGEGEHRTTCPSCGAPLAINASNRCEYCGALVSSEEHDWAISAIRGLSQVSGN